MSYSLIIPTMYYHVEQLDTMLTVYNALDLIGEILIINNCENQKVDFKQSKVQVIGDGINKFVNPSWKFGVESAKFEKVIIANDDITINGDLENLLEMGDYLLDVTRVLGPSEDCFSKSTNTNFVKLQKYKTKTPLHINYGYGVFMLMKKSVFLNTVIPDDFLIWYGDHLLKLQNEAWEFLGVSISTGMRGTTAKLNLKEQAMNERLAWKRFTANRVRR